MQDRDRGKQHTPALATQIRDFSGLRYGKITPTDIDCYLDFGDRLHVFTDAKLPGIDLPNGQRLALERLVDDMNDRGRYALGIICEHPNRVGVIDFATCEVVKYRFRRRWLVPQMPMDTKTAIDTMLKLCRLEYYIGKG